MRRSTGLAGGAVLVTLVVRVLRPRLRTLGATTEEASRRLPGDDLIGGWSDASTMATTIDAPPDAVWPWLAQMGLGRAGWYSVDRLDMFGGRSAHAILPALQELSVGQRIASSPGGKTWFTVELLEPGRVLGLVSRIDLRTGRSYAASAPRPSWSSEGAWVFVLEPAGGRTRLHVRAFGRSRPRFPFGVIDRLFGEPAHAIMQLRQFHGLRTRVATASADGGWSRHGQPGETTTVTARAVAS